MFNVKWIIINSDALRENSFQYCDRGKVCIRLLFRHNPIIRLNREHFTVWTCLYLCWNNCDLFVNMGVLIELCFIMGLHWSSKAFDSFIHYVFFCVSLSVVLWCCSASQIVQLPISLIRCVSWWCSWCLSLFIFIYVGYWCTCILLRNNNIIKIRFTKGSNSRSTTNLNTQQWFPLIFEHSIWTNFHDTGLQEQYRYSGNVNLETVILSKCNTNWVV